MILNEPDAFGGSRELIPKKLVSVLVLIFLPLVNYVVSEEIKVMGCDACWQGADSLKVG